MRFTALCRRLADMRQVAPSVAALLSGVALAAQTPTFSSRLEVVRLDVLVTADGKPVRDLTPR